MQFPAFPRLPMPPVPASFTARLPRLISGPARHAPFVIQRLLLEGLLSRMLHESFADGDFDFLLNKHLKIHIHDADLCWFFSFNGRKLITKADARADTCISGKLHDFLLLASRQEDPDTLFFQRRLQIEGDTELGLEVKNVLDSIDLSRLPEPANKILQQLTSVLNRAKPHKTKTV